MFYKNFQIRLFNDGNRYELIKWAENRKSCITIAFIEWDGKQKDFTFEMIGQRLFTEWEPGLDKFILAYVELIRISKD